MKNLLLGLTLTLLAQGTFAHEDTEAVSPARASELSVHRIERLVNLKKIDLQYISKLSTIEVKNLEHSSLHEANYQVTASQHAGIDGTQNKIEILMDGEGKTLSYNLLPGAAADNAPVWADKDPASLLENALHFILDNGVSNLDIKPFHESLVKTQLKKTNVNGEDLALVEFQASTTSATLSILLKLDGSFLSYEVK